MPSWLADGEVILLIGLFVGFAFGVFGQQSEFCLRAASVEFWHGKFGPRLAVWLLAFSAALLGTQYQMLTGSLRASDIRQLTGTGSMSGAIIGGALFGLGMVLARGCASRLLILSATGNIRALMAVLVLTVVAQASLRGVLASPREAISAWWTISASSRALDSVLPVATGAVLGVLLLLLGVVLARRAKLLRWTFVSAIGVGLAIAFGWWATNRHAGWSFEGGQAQSVSFTGPSADTLMALINSPSLPLTFGTGLVPGVFAGALLASVVTRQFRLQGFDANTGTLRYLVGAALMGFGSMLAGGCAVGAGVTGGAVLATTAWTALFAIWLAAGLGDLIVGRSWFDVDQSRFIRSCS